MLRGKSLCMERKSLNVEHRTFNFELRMENLSRIEYWTLKP
jgi:hypothetical protein